MFIYLNIIQYTLFHTYMYMYVCIPTQKDSVEWLSVGFFLSIDEQLKINIFLDSYLEHCFLVGLFCFCFFILCFCFVFFGFFLFF